MNRLTTDAPNGNFETMLNFVYGKDGWAYIRHDGYHENVLLTDWAKRQCKLRGCDEVLAETPEEIDQRLCDCMMDAPICPIAMAYCFASQAVHLRDRLKMYEDTGLGPEEITTEPYGCVFYCNRKCNLDGDFCAEGPGCPREIDVETAKHLLELAQIEKEGRLGVLEPTAYNDPLTLEQLLEMDGEPVFIKCLFNEELSSYVVIDRRRDSAGIFTRLFYASFEYYGDEWIAYRRKPEELK